MLPEVFKFNKTLQARRGEFTHLYISEDSCSNVVQSWSVGLEMVIKTVKNWQAIWAMPEDTCREYGAMHPCSVVVTVKEIIFDDLSAEATVDGIQDDITLPDTVSVPLFELYPTKKQTAMSTAEARSMANWLDQCRYFFLYLWYPWDSEKNIPIRQWADQHLENRLVLQNDLRNGTIEKAVANQIQCLIKEALDIVAGIDEEIEPNDTEESQQKQQLATVKSLVRKKTIKMELDLAEIPELRKTMVAYFKEKFQSCTALVCQAGNLRSLAQFLAKTETMIAEGSTVQMLTDIEHALKAFESNSTLYLASGSYHISSLGNFSYGGTIKGVADSPDMIKIEPSAVSPVPFVFLNCCGNVEMSGVSIERGEGAVMNVADGFLQMENCCISCKTESSVRGIIVQTGASLQVANCTFKNLGTGIVVKCNGTVQVISCSFLSCGEGIKSYDGADVSIRQSQFSACTVAAVAIETREAATQVSGKIDILDSFDEINVIESNFLNNVSDALITSGDTEVTL